MAVTVQVRCEGQFHDIRVTDKGQLAFLSHKNLADVERYLNLEELGGGPFYGCPAVLRAWRARNFAKLPEKLSNYLQRRDVDRHEYRSARRMRKRKYWGKESARLQGLDRIRVSAEKGVTRDDFLYILLDALVDELTRRGHTMEAHQEYDPCVFGSLVVPAMPEYPTLQPTVCMSIEYIPRNNIAASFMIDGIKYVNAVPLKNVHKAVRDAADAVEEVMVHKRLELYRLNESSRPREDLLRRASQINDVVNNKYFKVSPEPGDMSFTVKMHQMGNLSSAAARLIVEKLGAFEEWMDKLRHLSLTRKRR